MANQWELINGVLVTPKDIINNGYITIDGSIIKKTGKKGALNRGPQVDLSGLLVFPGLIDGHDHLLGTYLPRVGDRRPYMNWLAWDNDLKSSPIYAERQHIESSDLYLMGGFRHLISGVTSVQDHIPHFVRDIFGKETPIRLLKEYAMAHSVGSMALGWGDGIELEHQKAVKEGLPFITHCSEGFDDETLASVSVLNGKGAISEHSVLIHGIAFSDDDIELLAKNKSNVVWCPVSNLFMFEKTARVKELIDAGVNVVLGTDSPMSGSVNVFEEMFIAKNYYYQHYGEPLDDRLLVEMLTTNAAKAMFRPDLGTIEEETTADLLVIEGDARSPYRSLTSMSFADIMLVVIDGIPRYADKSFIPLFEALELDYQKIKVAGAQKIIGGDILGMLQRIRDAVGFHKELAFLPVEPW